MVVATQILLRVDNIQKKNCFYFQNYDIGLICVVCNNLICKDCIINFLNLMEIHKRNFHMDTKYLYDDFKNYVEHNIKPTSYIGHCCIIQHLAKKIIAPINNLQCEKSVLEGFCPGIVILRLKISKIMW